MNELILEVSHGLKRFYELDLSRHVHISLKLCIKAKELYSSKLYFQHSITRYTTVCSPVGGPYIPAGGTVSLVGPSHKLQGSFRYRRMTVYWNRGWTLRRQRPPTCSRRRSSWQACQNSLWVVLSLLLARLGYFSKRSSSIVIQQWRL